MFRERIEEHYGNLTPGFRRLADFILNQTLDVAFLTATELSRRVGIDPATVVRFSQEIGYSGFRELSREIKAHVRGEIVQTYRKAVEAGNEEDLVHALFASKSQDLEQFATTEAPHLAQALKTLKSAQRIWVVGEFPSYNIAQYLAESLAPLDIPIFHFTPGMAETAQSVNTMQPGDVLLALVFGTPGIDTGHAVKLVGAKGIPTVCITDNGTTLAAREAETVITTPGHSPLDISSFSVSLLIVATLKDALLNSKKETALAYMAQIENALKETKQAQGN